MSRGELASASPGSAAAIDFGSKDAPVNGSKFIIKQFFYDEEITPQEVVDAYSDAFVKM